MRKYLIGGFAVLLVIVAILPWIIGNSMVEPIVPDELRRAPSSYAETVQAIQFATRAAERQATSEPNVQIIGTVMASPSAITIDVSTTSTTGSQVVIRTVGPDNLTATANRVNTTSTAPAPSELTLSPTSLSDVPTLTPTILTEEPSPSTIVSISKPTEVPSTSPLPERTILATPVVRWVFVEDVITAEMLTEQIAKDASDDTVTDLSISISQEGLIGTGQFKISERVYQPIEVICTPMVNLESLIVIVQSIKVGGVDVTEEERTRLESRLASSLYRLLPERFVDSFVLDEGKITVRSRMRP